MRHHSFARIIKVSYNLYWEERENHRQLVRRLEILEEHLAYLKTQSVKKLSLIVYDRRYRNYIRSEAKDATRSIKLCKNRIKFLRSKITFFTRQIPLG